MRRTRCPASSADNTANQNQRPCDKLGSANVTHWTETRGRSPGEVAGTILELVRVDADHQCDPVAKEKQLMSMDLPEAAGFNALAGTLAGYEVSFFYEQHHRFGNVV